MLHLTSCQHPRSWSHERLAPARCIPVSASRADLDVGVDTLPGPDTSSATPRRLLHLTSCLTSCQHPRSWSHKRLAPAGCMPVSASPADLDAAWEACSLPCPCAPSATPGPLLHLTSCQHPRSWSHKCLAPAGCMPVSASRADLDATWEACCLPRPCAPSATPGPLPRPHPQFSACPTFDPDRAALTGSETSC